MPTQTKRLMFCHFVEIARVSLDHALCIRDQSLYNLLFLNNLWDSAKVGIPIIVVWQLHFICLQALCLEVGIRLVSVGKP